MSKCLYCYKELRPGEVDFHPECARRMFGTSTVPLLPYSRDNMSELASKVIRASTSVTGVQAKLSLEIDRGKRNEPCFIPYILKKMADVRGVSEEHMAQTVIDNFHRYLNNE